MPLSRDEWDDYDKRQEFEHQLIDRKTTWLLTSQSILFAAYGVTLNATASGDLVSSFRRVVAVAGLLIAVFTWVGVVALINSKRLSFREYREYFDDPAVDLPKPLNRRALQWGVDTRNTCFVLLPDVLLPLVFVGAWLVLR